MTKKNNTPSGTLFSPELREVVRRLEGKESELEAVFEREGTVRKSTEQMKIQSREVRFELHRLIHEQGKLPEEALRTVLPSDKHRKKKLMIWERHGLWPLSSDEFEDYGELSHQHTTHVPHEEEEKTKPMPTTQVPQLDSDTVAVLREVAEWWRKKKEAGMLESDLSLEPRTLEPSYRPHFPGPRRNTGVRLHERLLRDALAKAKTEETKIGKGLSPLIEHLFWAYLNFDPKYLQAKTDDDKEETPPSPVQPEAGPQ